MIFENVPLAIEVPSLATSRKSAVSITLACYEMEYEGKTYYCLLALQ